MIEAQLRAECCDCHRPYAEFGLDTILSDEQWAMVWPNRDGLLCANCIVRRASSLPGIIIVRASLEFAETGESAMEKQAVIKPGVTPDLDPTTELAEKAAGDRSEKDEIERLEKQDVTSRLAVTSDQ